MAAAVEGEEVRFAPDSSLEGLVGFVANANELWPPDRLPISPEVLGEALSPQLDHAICRRKDRLG
jgi:hypothetical protein